jgi:hypothetical protein
MAKTSTEGLSVNSCKKNKKKITTEKSVTIKITTPK